MRRQISTVALAATVVAGAGVLTAPTSMASSGDEVTGTCSAGSSAEAEAKVKKGKLRLEFDVRTSVVGEPWTLTVSDASQVLYTNTQATWLDLDDSDDDDLPRVSLRDRGGDDDDDDRYVKDDTDDDNDSVSNSGSNSGSNAVSNSGSNSGSSSAVGFDDDTDDDVSLDDETMDDADDVSTPSVQRIAKVEWKPTINRATGVVTYTMTAVNTVTGETCSATITK